MPTNENLKTSFDFPEFLTVGQYAAYQRAAADALEKLGKQETQSATEALAIIFTAARDAGLIQNWKSAAMPDLYADDLNAQHAFTIIWTAQQVSEWIERERHVDPKSFWRLLIPLIETARRLLTLLSRGVASVSDAFRVQAG